ncbi:cytochrome P450 [Archangium gephyra]|uniref:Cytochrome P450 n=1 Tax=Archangium gephyra TaxID=48 RepID=A0AAC8Q827_9BACT|nr:cytochrome P450 [Archangium gephyra]AKJ02534.1 cytochrome P450 [Archangium gephyra]REG28545.1 cytochrome P450 [Archangium gephyra]
MTHSFKSVPRIKESALLGSWSEFKSDRLGLVLRVMRECGELGEFHVGPVSMYFPTGPKLLHQILVEQADKFTTEPFMANFYPVLGRTTLPGIDGAHHRRIRRIMAPAFQPKRMMAYAEHMVGFADEVQRGMVDGSEVEIVGVMQHLALKILAKSVFHLEFNEDKYFFDCIHVASEYVGVRVSNPVQLPLWVPTPRNRRDQAAIAHLRGRARSLLEEGRQRGDKGDVLSLLLTAKDEDGTGLSEAELLDQILTLYIAGHETTANALSFAFMLLGQHPESQAKLQAEVDSVLGGRAPTYEDAPKLTYTLQVIKESLRMFPPAVFFGRAPIEDLEIEGYRFRKGQFCLLSPYAIHRNPEFFPEPERFAPERFTPENEKKLPRNTYLPFGTGPHVCIGQYFALLEAQLVLAHICQNVNVSLVPNQQIRLMPLATLGPSPFRVKVTRRKTATALAS